MTETQGKKRNKQSKDPNIYPRGWDAAKVRRVIDYYESQTDEEAAAEDDAIFARPSETVMQVPAKLVPAVRRLIARHERRTRRRRKVVARNGKAKRQSRHAR